jgi:hypothetical protein
MTEIKDVLAERGARYGDFEGQAAIAIELKALVRSELNKRQKCLKPDQLHALDVISDKIARILNGDPDYADNWVDIAGYATLVANRLEGKT